MDSIPSKGRSSVNSDAHKKTMIDSSASCEPFSSTGHSLATLNTGEA